MWTPMSSMEPFSTSSKFQSQGGFSFLRSQDLCQRGWAVFLFLFWNTFLLNLIIHHTPTQLSKYNPNILGWKVLKNSWLKKKKRLYSIVQHSRQGNRAGTWESWTFIPSLLALVIRWFLTRRSLRLLLLWMCVIIHSIKKAQSEDLTWGSDSFAFQLSNHKWSTVLIS